MKQVSTIHRHKPPKGLIAVYAVLFLYCGFNILSFLLLFSGSLKGKSELFSSSLWALPPFVIAIPLFDILGKLSLLNSLNGLIIVYVTKQLPFSIFVLTSFYKGIPYDLEEAAVIDGASPLRTFAQIVMPLTLPAMVAVTINNLLNVWNEFLYALIFLTDKDIYTLPIGLFYLSQAAEYSSSWTILFAGMMISIIPVLIIFAVFQKQFASGVSQGAVKG